MVPTVRVVFKQMCRVSGLEYEPLKRSCRRTDQMSEDKTHRMLFAKSDPEAMDLTHGSQASVAAIASNITFYLVGAVEDEHQQEPSQDVKTSFSNYAKCYAPRGNGFMSNSLPPGQTYKEWLFQAEASMSGSYSMEFWSPDGQHLLSHQSFNQVNDALNWARQVIDELAQSWLGFEIRINLDEENLQRLKAACKTLPAGETLIVNRELTRHSSIKDELPDSADVNTLSQAFQARLRQYVRDGLKYRDRLYIHMQDNQRTEERQAYWWHLLFHDLKLKPQVLEQQEVWTYVYTRWVFLGTPSIRPHPICPSYST